MTSYKFDRLTGTGTSQEGRAFSALKPDYVKVDERGFEDLLVFASDFSALINYYNLSGEVEGDWSEFISDDTVILASITDCKPSAIEKRFKENLQKALLFKRPEKKIRYFDKCFREIFDIALRFQSWFVRLKAVENFSNQDLDITGELSDAISGKLKDALTQVYTASLDLIYSVGSNNLCQLNEHALDEVWGISEVRKEHSPTGIINYNHTVDVLERAFQSFFETLLYLKLKAPEYLRESLKRDNHYPEVSLFLSFLRLFQIAQGNINKLTGRHLDFYYNSILQQHKKEAQRDRVYLQFFLYDSAPLAEVKKGTGFYAGKDDQGQDIIYYTDKNFLVNHADINKLRTVYIGRNSFNVNGKETVFYDGILAADHSSDSLTKKPGQNTPGKLLAAFGESQAGKGSQEKTMSQADIGFSISSPVLFLKEGRREVEFELVFSTDSYKKLYRALNEIATLEQNSEKEIFIKCLSEAFELSFTGTKGWHRVRKYGVAPGKSGNSLIFSFEVEESEPEVVGYDPDIHGRRYEAEAPVIEVKLSSEPFIYPYSLLNELVLEEVEIKINVTGVKDLVLFNNTGQLNPDNPFYPFGPVPASGSYLVIGSNEVFSKKLTGLNVNIEWFDLPGSSSGFYGHYSAYNTGLNNQSFEAGISVLDGGKWKPGGEEQQIIKLFRSEGKPGQSEPEARSALDSETYIRNLDTGIISLEPDYGNINKNSSYTSTSKRGFMKIELTGPENAFAHGVYPAILSEKTIQQSKSRFLKTKRTKAGPLPEPPYTPQVKSLSVDYSSSSMINLRSRSGNQSNGGKVFHIHPFGENLVYPDTSSDVTYMLPDYSYEGSLLIGLKDLNPPQTLSLLFELVDDYTVSSEEDPPVVKWSFLADNKWIAIKPSGIIRNDTNGFIKTGIIEVAVPYEINRNNTILDPELYWLKISVMKNIEAASKLLSICSQVTTATLDSEYQVRGDHLKKPLPPFSVMRSVENIEGLEEVQQPLCSFAGRPEEEDSEFYTRVSERLRHKSRAVMPWDYERLILENFPELHKVACLPNMTSENPDSPGSVLLVVSAHENDNFFTNEPMAGSELLYQVKTFMKDLVSPFVKLEVRNPAYERLRIICSVKFRSGYNYGFFLQKLNEELKKYLTKGVSLSSTAMNLGGKVNTSDVLSFMRTLPYVDFITRFSMVQAARDLSGNWVLIDTAREGEVKSFLQATKPWSVLVPSAEHQITVLNVKSEERSLQAGINSLELGNDFIIE